MRRVAFSFCCSFCCSFCRWLQQKGFGLTVACACMLAVGVAGCTRTVYTPMETVRTEYVFQDNKGEVDYLLTDNGKQSIVLLHVKAIINYIDHTDK